MSASVQGQPMLEPAAAPKPLTGAALMRRMRRDPHYKRRIRNLDRIPLGGEIVLRAVAELVAENPDTLQFDFEPGLLQQGLAQEIADHRGWTGGVASIKAALDALADCGLLGLDDRRVWLCLPEEPAAPPPRVQTRPDGTVVMMPVQPHSAGPARFGRPRKGETLDQYRARTAEERQRRAEAARVLADATSGQPPLPLPVTVVPSHGGGFVVGLRAGLGGGLMPGLSGGLSLAGDFPGGKSEVLDKSGDKSAGGDGKVGLSGLAVVVVEESGLSTGKSEDGYIPSATTTAREADFPENKSDQKCDDLLEASAAALAGDVIRRLGMRNGAAIRAREQIRKWLGEGIPAAILSKVFREGLSYHDRTLAEGGDGIKEIGWFKKPVTLAVEAQCLRETAGQPGAAEPSPAPAPPDDPRLEAVPPASRSAVMRVLGRLDAMAADGLLSDDPPGAGHDAYRGASFLRQHDRPSWDALAAICPHVAAWWGEGPAYRAAAD